MRDVFKQGHQDIDLVITAVLTGMHPVGDPWPAMWHALLCVISLPVSHSVPAHGHQSHNPPKWLLYVATYNLHRNHPCLHAPYV